MMTHLSAGNPEEINEITKLGAEVVQSGLGRGFHFNFGEDTRISQTLEESMNPQNAHCALR